MQTLRDINDVFDKIVREHGILQSFHTISLKEVDIDKFGVDKYPLLYANCNNVRIDKGSLEFSYEVIVGTLVIEEQQDDLTDIYNETLHLMQDVVAQFHASISGNAKAESKSDYVVDLPISCTPFSSRFDNLLLGWSTSFTIRVPQEINLCDAIF